MKKIISIFLITCLLVYSAGFFVSYHLQLDSTKRQIKIAITKKEFSTKNLVTIDASLAEENEEGEIVVDGKMYDVVEKKMEGNKIMYTCIADEDETNLVNNYCQQMTEQQNGHHKKLPNFRFEINPFIAPQATKLFAVEKNAEKNYASFTDVIFPTSFLNIPSPPPWF